MGGNLKLSNLESKKQKKSITSVIQTLWKWITKFFNILSIFTILIQIFILLVLSTTNPELVFTFIFIFFFLDTAIALMTSKKNLESQILNISFIVLSVSSLIIYGIVYYIKVYYIPAYPNLIHIGSVDTWISFSGSILSGLIVMLSLVFTIKHERLIRDEDKMNEYLPIMECHLECNNYNKNSTVFSSNNDWYLIITNIGENPIREISINNLETIIYLDKQEISKIEFEKEQIDKLTYNLIAKGKSCSIKLPLLDHTKIDMKFTNIKLLFNIKYKDITLKNKHSHQFTALVFNTLEYDYFISKGYTILNIYHLKNEFIS